MQIPTFKDKLHLVDIGLARVSKNKNLWTFKYKSDVMYKDNFRILNYSVVKYVKENTNEI